MGGYPKQFYSLIDCGTTNGTRLKSQGLKKITQTVVLLPIRFTLQIRKCRCANFSLQTSYSRSQDIEPAPAGDTRCIFLIAPPIEHRYQIAPLSKLIHGDYGLAKTPLAFGVLGSTVLSAILMFAGGLAEEFCWRCS